MKKRFFTPGLVALALVSALTLALLSVSVERIGPELVQDGNLCGPSGNDPCYKPALKGGFPFAYLYDQPGISVQGQLAFIEDEFRVGGLILDIAVYFVLALPMLRMLQKLVKARD